MCIRDRYVDNFFELAPSEDEERYESEIILRKMSALYEDIRHHNCTLGKNYRVINLYRRIWTAFMITLFYDVPALQVTTVIVSHVFMLGLCIYYRPYIDPVHNFQDIHSNLLLTIICICLARLQGVKDYDDKVALGWFVDVLIAILCTVHYFYVIKASIRAYKRTVKSIVAWVYYNVIRDKALKKNPSTELSEQKY
eukprot:TRINITY_DN10994_c0_g1_i2.p1 TRINITY_DN10994_c0_g1~~TRINITY_DN10994_c0_g1_i2.p1  ORF type:complete len:216 (-),score=34.49 TRINITY_DN10994_c0_g1_i2:94-681(-)